MQKINKYDLPELRHRITNNNLLLIAVIGTLMMIVLILCLIFIFTVNNFSELLFFILISAISLLFPIVEIHKLMLRQSSLYELEDKLSKFKE